MRAGPYHWPTPPIGPSAWLRPCLIHLLLGGAMKTRLCLRWLPALLIVGCAGQDAAGPTLPPMGRLEISVIGLPDSIAAIAVTGPSGYARTVTATTVLSGLVVGQYTITASNVMTSTFTYVPEASSDTVIVTADSPATAAVNYRPATGSATGSWSISAVASGSTGVCGLSLTLVIVQIESDSVFSATGQESGSCPGHGYAWGGLTTTGIALNGAIRFQLAPCSYLGAIATTRPDSMGGSVTCSVVTRTGTRPGCAGNRCGGYRIDSFIGTWSAVNDGVAVSPISVAGQFIDVADAPSHFRADPHRPSTRYIHASPR